MVLISVCLSTLLKNLMVVTLVLAQMRLSHGVKLDQPPHQLRYRNLIVTELNIQFLKWFSDGKMSFKFFT